MSSSAQNQAFNQWLPVGLFVSFFIAIAVATLHFAPSWGLMDDFGLLKLAREFKASSWDIGFLAQNSTAAGMLRPFYFSWAALFYGIFEHWPTGFYILIAACNMLAMIIWGMVFHDCFGGRREDRSWTIFFYPLTFFLFIPFWNIFNYLSLQEKFVTFFAPLAIWFFHRTYRQMSIRDIVLLYVCILLGLMSKATFIYVPFILFAYALLDLLIFRYRPRTSAFFALVNGMIFAGYAFFTMKVQMKGDYTAKYRDGLEVGSFLTKLVHLPVLMKFLVILGIAGGLAVFVWVLIKKQRERSLAIMIYMALICYVVLLLPWGYQSYLISAMAPLAMGALFPVYAWLTGRNTGIKLFVNGLIVVLLSVVFIGNIVPSISRMADIGRAIEFLRIQPGTEADIYFMPPGYIETAETTQKFTQKKVYYCGDGVIASSLLSVSGRNFVILTDLFPSIHLSGVWAGNRIYTNGTWEIFEITEQKGHEEKFVVPFRKTWLQQLKVKIRDM